MKEDIKGTKKMPRNKVNTALIQALVKKDLESLEATSCAGCFRGKCKGK